MAGRKTELAKTCGTLGYKHWQKQRHEQRKSNRGLCRMFSHVRSICRVYCHKCKLAKHTRTSRLTGKSFFAKLIGQTAQTISGLCKNRAGAFERPTSRYCRRRG